MFRCTDPNWHGTATTETDIHFCFLLALLFFKSTQFWFSLCTYHYKSTFSTIRAEIENEINSVNEFA